MKIKLCSAIAVSALLAMQSGSALAQSADVLHFWTSDAESAAMKIYADAFEANGGKWTDNAVAGTSNALAMALNRIAGGNPPSVLLDSIRDVADFQEQGILMPIIPEVAGPVLANIPEVLVDRVSFDGQLYAIPINIGGNSWMWYSTKAFDDIGAEPPTTWDEFFTVGDQLKAKGYIPLAFGGQAWQISLVFYDLLQGQGRENFKNVTVGHDAEAAGGPETVKAFEIMRKLTDYVDEGNEGRAWNEATSLVIQNKAAMQLMGDWAKGEFLNAGLSVGDEFGCVPAPGTGDSYRLVVDVFDFPKVSDPDLVAGQELFQKTVSDPAVQAKFTGVKGSLPGLLNAELPDADMCQEMGLKSLSDPEAQVLNSDFVYTADQEGQVRDLVAEFWSSPDLSAEDAAARFADIVAQSEK